LSRPPAAEILGQMLSVRRALALAFSSSVLAIAPPPALADAPGGAPACRVVDVDFLPSEDLQLVAWIEDTKGHFVSTIFITQLTGTYGLGNRPGIHDFNSGPRWPYGRREGVFPVWAHRHGQTFPRLDFQNYDDNAANDRNLSHPFTNSSVEQFFCRPLRPDEAMWDTQTCATVVYTDKGTLSPTAKSLYPPREDIVMHADIDSPSVGMYEELNPFDAVSKATPPAGVPYRMSWPIPDTLPVGDYVLWVEASKEFDFNSTYNPTSYPEPPGIPWADYGEPFRGQPSVVYKVPFAIGMSTSIQTTASYVGYGDVDGADGTLFAPDGTITSSTPGSGAARLLLRMDDHGDMYRVRVESRPEFDYSAPGRASDASLVEVTANTATISFVAPGDDGDDGTVSGYEIRYLAATQMNEANFERATLVSAAVAPDEPGQVQTVKVEGLLPQTSYFVGIRAYDECQNKGPLTIVALATTERQTGEVDACFVATAAYGSLLANDVEMLRRFRDAFLRKTTLGELAVETYYTFGPAVAGVVGQSEQLRGVARDGLAPIVDWARGLAY